MKINKFVVNKSLVVIFDEDCVYDNRQFEYFIKELKDFIIEYYKDDLSFSSNTEISELTIFKTIKNKSRWWNQ